jgi:hypothetical protein
MIGKVTSASLSTTHSPWASLVAEYAIAIVAGAIIAATEVR